METLRLHRQEQAMALGPSQPRGQAQPGFGQAPGLPRTPRSPQSHPPANAQGTLHSERCPKEMGALGGFFVLFFPCFCHKVWVRRWPECHHLSSELDPRWEPSPRALQLALGVPGQRWRSGEAPAGSVMLAVLGKIGAAPRSGGMTA